jgi:pimeloyl-ACP methyl ester carboxylesterase
MNRKTAEALAIAYHRWKIELIGLFSPRLAAQQAYLLFTIPPPPRKPLPLPQSPESKAVEFTFRDFTIRGHRWESRQTNGKKVLLAHGFRSYGLKFEHLAKALMEKGYTVYAFDAPAHGNSDGKKVEAISYRDMILEADRIFGPFQAGVGHSFGGLSLALATEKFANPAGRKIIFIAPATETSRSIGDLFRIIPVRKAIRDAFFDLVKEKAQVPVSHFSVNRIVQSTPCSVLWIHDENDEICPLSDLKSSLDKHPANVQFLITKGLGHNQVYKDAGVVNHLVEFINNPES